MYIIILFIYFNHTYRFITIITAQSLFLLALSFVVQTILSKTLLKYTYRYSVRIICYR